MISTHALREEGDYSSSSITAALWHISTHALREEGDLGPNGAMLKGMQFLPTPSARRATTLGVYYIERYAISTHALREEGDAANR